MPFGTRWEQRARVPTGIGFEASDGLQGSGPEDDADAGGHRPGIGREEQIHPDDELRQNSEDR
ncbi:hypothetical protein ACFQ9Q_24950 [Streptomyces virginiae]|uniref:hypothetical protein n=1 Tax=Streptomyces virginiae TaxID=1961 RepID=UPI003692F28C